MSETALKFGPEWLRNLSHGGSINSPPSSPGPMKFKLADYRYGREEMLALFSKDFQPPDGLDNLGSLYMEHMQEPLAFMPMNIEEERVWQRVNSEAVPRNSVRAPTNGIGRGRGGSVDRGRGRGRGFAPPYFNRGVSYDDDPTEYRGVREQGPPGMTRLKSFERTQSITENRGWPIERPAPVDRTLGVEESALSVSPQKGRAAIGNWRARGDFEEEADRWKGLSQSSRNEAKWGGNRAGWREGEWEEGRGGHAPGSTGHAPGSTKSTRPPWESERDGRYRRQWEELPEWATETADDKGGSFDATGAFHAPGSSDEEEMTNGEEDEKGREENDLMRNGKRMILPEENGENHGPNMDWVDDKTEYHNNEMDKMDLNSSGGHNFAQRSSPATNPPLVNGILSDHEVNSHMSHTQPVSNSHFIRHEPQKQHESPALDLQPPSTRFGSKKMEGNSFGEEDNLEHMQSAADDLVAKLVGDLDDDEHKMVNDRNRILQPPPGGFVPPEVKPPSEEKWFYTDPQGDVQGPFLASEMAAWYKAGYFKPTLLLQRECDDKFAQLGDLTKVFGRVPFLPGPAVPPLKLSELLNAQKAEAERQRLELLQAQLLQKQLYQQQTTHRQQQVLQSLQSLEEWNSLSPSQQQQLFMQHLMALPPLAPPQMPPSNPPNNVTPAAIPGNSIPQTVPDLRASPNNHSGVQHSQKPDPIQAFVAQMASSASSQPLLPSEPIVPSQPHPPPSSSPGGEGPLQKLLLQLQRGPQPSIPPSQPPIVGPNLAAAVTSGGPVPEKSPEQFDTIQSLMKQLNRIHGQSPVSEVEEQRRIEEEKRRFETQRREEEERIKRQEFRLQEERLKEEERRRELEMKNKKLEEELKKMQANQVKKKETENAVKKEQMKGPEANKKEEELKKSQAAKQKQQKQEDEATSKKALKKAQREEEQRKKEEQKAKNEEERKRKEKEKERQHQMQLQEEMRRSALEEERRRMQQLEKEEKKRQKQEEQTRKQQAKSAAEQEKTAKNASGAGAWNASTGQIEKAAAPSLAEIQKAQEIKEKKEREAEQHREKKRQKELQRQAAEEKKQREMASWVSLCASNNNGPAKKAGPSSSQKPPPIKSLVEIQKEEEKELKKRLEKEKVERAAAVSHMTLNSAGVWGSASQSLSWANRASTGAVPPPPSNSGNTQSWGSQASNAAWSAVAQTADPSNLQNSGGFWDSPETFKNSKSSSGPRSPLKSGAGPHGNPSAAASSNPHGSNSGGANQAVISNKNNKKKAKEDSESAFSRIAGKGHSGPAGGPSDGFKQWCRSVLNAMKVDSTVDVPTFVGFLSDVESPYEVHDYIRLYLGDSKEVKEFAKHYLDRRSRARNAQKENRLDDNILAPAPAVNPASSLEFQEVKTRLKKGKKKNMQKVDSSILGFSMPANENLEIED